MADKFSDFLKKIKGQAAAMKMGEAKKWFGDLLNGVRKGKVSTQKEIDDFLKKAEELKNIKRTGPTGPKIPLKVPSEWKTSPTGPKIPLKPEEPANPSVSDVSGTDYLNKSKSKTKLDVADLGKLFMHVYDAKHKETLPYWDLYPLMIPYAIETHFDDKTNQNLPYIKAINLHYLPPVLRARLFDALYKVGDGDARKINMKRKITGAMAAYFKPCFTTYIQHSKYVKSQFLEIHSDYWEYVMLLPLENYKKYRNNTYINVPSQTVWNDSVKKAGE